MDKRPIDPDTAVNVMAILDSIDLDDLRRRIDAMQRLLVLLEGNQENVVPIAVPIVTPVAESRRSEKPYGYWGALIDQMLADGPKTVSDISRASGAKSADEKALSKGAIRSYLKSHTDKYRVSSESNGVMLWETIPRQA